MGGTEKHASLCICTECVSLIGIWLKSRWGRRSKKEDYKDRNDVECKGLTE